MECSCRTQVAGLDKILSRINITVHTYWKVFLGVVLVVVMIVCMQSVGEPSGEDSYKGQSTLVGLGQYTL